MNITEMRKKILLVASVFAPEPVVESTLMTDLAEELSGEYDVTVVRPTPTRPLGFKMPPYDDNDPLRPYRVVTLNTFTCPQSSLKGRFKEYGEYGKAAAEYIHQHHDEIDLIYNAAWPLYGKMHVGRAARKYGIPYITAVQDIYPESLASKLPGIPGLKALVTRMFLSVDKENLQGAVLVHTISEKMADDLGRTRKLPADRFVVVRNWQDERQFSDPKPVSGGKDAPFTFMYMGNVGPLAGIDTLLDAVALLKTADKPFRLVVAGSGSAKERLMKRVADEQLGNVEFWDVPSGAVPATQAKADVMMLPVMKGYALSSVPSKLPAYMFSARPIIAGVDAESDTAKCVLDGECGWAIEPENPAVLAKTMLEAMSNSVDRLTSMGMNGRNYALKYLGRTSNLMKLANAFRTILNG